MADVSARFKNHGSWAGALKRANITRRLHTYDLRHAFATQTLESGADIGAVANVMASAPETIRRHYQHVSRALAKATVELIPELEISPEVQKDSLTNTKRKRHVK